MRLFFFFVVAVFAATTESILLLRIEAFAFRRSPTATARLFGDATIPRGGGRQWQRRRRRHRSTESTTTSTITTKRKKVLPSSTKLQLINVDAATHRTRTEKTEGGSPTEPSAEDRDEETMLTFRGDYAYRSEPFSIGIFDGGDDDVRNNATLLVDFFGRQDTKRLLFGANGKRDVRTLEVTPHLSRLWELARTNHYDRRGRQKLLPVTTSAVLPTADNNDDGAAAAALEFLECKTTVDVLGLVQVVVTVCGVMALSSSAAGDDVGNNNMKKTKRGSRSQPFPMSLPEYEYFLIGERQQAFGPKPLVWIFNKMMSSTAADRPDTSDVRGAAVVDETGNVDTSDQTVVDDDSPTSFKPCRTFVHTRIAVIEIEAGEARQEPQLEHQRRYVIQFDLDMFAQFDGLPHRSSLARKMVPFPKAMLEKRVSNAILRAIVKDVPDSIEATREALSEYCNNSIRR